MQQIEINFENDLKTLKEEKTFDFVKDVYIKNILYEFFAYVFSIYHELDFLNNKKILELKTHTIILYLGSIIEASLYYFINEKFKNDDKKRKKYLKIIEFKSIQKIKIENWDKKYHICELEEKEISLNDTINFSALLNWAKDNKLIDLQIIEKANNIRKMRNSIHINVYKAWEKINFYELEKVFIDTKIILDYIEENI